MELQKPGFTEIRGTSRENFEIPGYKTFKKDRLNREGGGVMLYVRGHLDPVECKIETEHEMVGVVLNKLEKKLHIYLVYRPPHQNAESDESLYSNLSTKYY